MTQPNNPLHGIKLADMLTELHEFYGWEYLGLELNLNCFKKSIEINPNFLHAYHNIGSIYIQIGKFDEAKKNFFL